MELDYDGLKLDHLKALVPLQGGNALHDLESICFGPELALLREVEGVLFRLAGRTEPVAMSLKQKGAAVAVLQNLNSRGLLSTVRSSWYHPLESPIALDLGYLFCRIGSEWGLLDPIVKLEGLNAYLEGRTDAVIPGERLVQGTGSNAFLPLVKIEHARDMRGVAFEEPTMLMCTGNQFVECGFTLEHGFLPLVGGRVYESNELLVDNNIESWNRFYGFEYRVKNDRLEFRTYNNLTTLEGPVPQELQDQVVRYLKGERERTDLHYPAEEHSHALVTFDAGAYAGRVHGSNPTPQRRARCSDQWIFHCDGLNRALMLNDVMTALARERGGSKAIIVGQIIGDSCMLTFPYMRAYKAAPAESAPPRSLFKRLLGNQ